MHIEFLKFPNFHIARFEIDRTTFTNQNLSDKDIRHRYTYTTL